jgi:flagellar biosynthesis/type III secretory pathway protein FliH
MAAIPNYILYNENRQELLKIKNANNDTLLLTKEEVKEILIKYIDEELDFFTSGITKRRVDEIIEGVNYRLNRFEKSLDKHINDKINEITEKIIKNSTTNIIEQRVNEKLTEKLENLKKLL